MQRGSRRDPFQLMYDDMHQARARGYRTTRLRSSALSEVPSWRNGQTNRQTDASRRSQTVRGSLETASLEWAPTCALKAELPARSRLADSRVLRNECDQVQNDGSAIEARSLREGMPPEERYRTDQAMYRKYDGYYTYNSMHHASKWYECSHLSTACLVLSDITKLLSTGPRSPSQVSSRQLLHDTIPLCLLSPRTSSTSLAGSQCDAAVGRWRGGGTAVLHLVLEEELLQRPGHSQAR
ncbi:hypothetical protein M440DRAFT_1227436 [Trichoderma longibrachiatum ATCC 18648]|uniref:Uncharacterized protein n=1 Tax=Trichoderma longibrachiatum ATCC 18648 TaxID=983965 RepID=A0A2T4C8R1_TRILO|nr:hypothetical protein M440DRAFT_1227436 [Trichoderma longibrachiatum ATCC 18648]